MPYLEYNDVKLHYMTEGDPTKPPLVLLHWFMGSYQTWYDIGWVRQLQPYFYLIIPDLRGYGQSTKFYDPQAYQPENHVRDIRELLAVLDQTDAHFFGYSMGGRIAFALGAYAPDLVRSLVIGGMHPYGSDSIPTDLNERIKLLEQGMEPLLRRYGIGPKSVFERMAENDAQALQADTRQTKRWPDLSPALEHFTQSVLIFVGRKDGFYTGARQISQQLPHGRFVAFTGETHRTAFLKRKLLWPHLKRFYNL